MSDDVEALDERAVPEADRIDGPAGDGGDGGDAAAATLAERLGWVDEVAPPLTDDQVEQLAKMVPTLDGISTPRRDTHGGSGL